MSILATLAGTAGGLAVGTVFGGLALGPRVGPWRGTPPAPGHPAPPQVVVLTHTDPAALHGVTVPPASAPMPIPGEVARGLGAPRGGEGR